MKKNKRLIALILVLVIAVGSFGGYKFYQTYAATQVDSSKCVSFENFRSSHAIPETTIFIGTHLITLESVTDELWTMALDSQVSSNQSEIYYKSELGGGQWYEISDGRDLSTISSDGTPVDEKDLGPLLVQYYTFEDGITKNAIDDAAKCIFDGEYPYYDLYHLEELADLKTQYDILKELKSDSKMDNYYISISEDLYGKDLRTDRAKTCDTQLYALQNIYNALSQEGNKDDAAIIYKLMAKLDNERRSIIFYQLSEDEETPELNTFYNKGMGLIEKPKEEVSDLLNPDGSENSESSEEEVETTVIEDYVANTQFLDAIGSGMEESASSYSSRLNNILSPDSDRVLDKAIFETSSQIIDAADGGLNDDMRANIKKLGYLFNIDEGVVVDAAEELKLLEEDGGLIAQASDKFKASVNAGEPDEYAQAINENKSEIAIAAILDEKANEIDMNRIELQTLITAVTERMSEEDGASFTAKRVEITDAMYRGVKANAMKSRCNAQVASHIKWLTDLLAKLSNNMDGMGSELDKLNEQIDNLEYLRECALDDNDLALAKQYLAEIEDLKDKRDEEEAKLAGLIDDPNANSVEQALAQAKLMASQTLEGVLQNLLSDALDRINSGNLDDLETTFDVFAALGATDELNKLKSSLNDIGNASDSLMNKLNDALNTANDKVKDGTALASNSGNGNGSGSGNGSGDGNGNGSGDGNGNGSGDGNGNGSGDGNGSGSGDGNGSGSGDGNGSGSGNGNGSGSGNGSGDGTGSENDNMNKDNLFLSEDQLMALLNMLVGDFDSLGPDGQIVVIRALNLMEQEGSLSAKKLAASLVNRCANNSAPKNKYIYKQLNDVTAYDYVQLKCLADVAGYRYVYKKSNSLATLAKADKKFEFSVGTDLITLSDGSQETINGKTKFDYYPYSTIEAAKTYFNCTAVKINSSSYGICITSDMESRAQELFTKIMEN